MHLLLHIYAEGASGLSLPVLEDRGVSWRGKKCFVFQLRFTYFLFIYFCTMINCTALWETEMVHVKIKEQQNGETQFGKQLEHLKIKGGNRNDRVLRRINFLFVI